MGLSCRIVYLVNIIYVSLLFTYRENLVNNRPYIASSHPCIVRVSCLVVCILGKCVTIVNNNVVTTVHLKITIYIFQILKTKYADSDSNRRVDKRNDKINANIFDCIFLSNQTCLILTNLHFERHPISILKIFLFQRVSLFKVYLYELPLENNTIYSNFLINTFNKQDH